MSTPQRSFGESAKRVGPVLVLSAAVAVSFQAQLSVWAMVAIVVVCLPLSAIRRRFNRGSAERAAPASVEKPDALSGSPVALATIGFAMKVLSVRFAGETFDLLGTTFLLLATFLTIWLAKQRLGFPDRVRRDVVLDVFYGASGWAAIAVAGFLTMVLAPRSGAMLMVAGATAVSCVMGSVFRFPLVLTQNQALLVVQRRALSRR